MTYNELARQLYDAYEDHKESSISVRRFAYAEFVDALHRYSSGDFFQMHEAGLSFEGRSIYRLHTGSGKRTILLWSQMHGDESTATAALLDIFKFLSAKDAFDEVRTTILDNLNLHFVPMLNPDGAELFTRRTAQGIDMNRDALQLQTPEARLLKAIQHELKPEFGFNLHDQDFYYSAGESNQPASLSFLAPAFDAARTVDAGRLSTMKVIVCMHKALEQFIGGKIGRYSDAYEPRAFGDNIQKWGTACILIESGGYPGDIEKQYIRKLNFVSILTALYTIARNEYDIHTQDEYLAIPPNIGNKLFDLIVRNTGVEWADGSSFRADIGIRDFKLSVRNEINLERVSKIDDLGDLSVSYGLQELDGSTLTARKALTYPDVFESVSELNRVLPLLLQQRYASFRVLNQDTSALFPVAINSKVVFDEITYQSPAWFFLSNGMQCTYAVLDGVLIALV